MGRGWRNQIFAEEKMKLCEKKKTKVFSHIRAISSLEKHKNKEYIFKNLNFPSFLAQIFFKVPDFWL